jgi:predicted O-methyltransferase YrrM
MSLRLTNRLFGSHPIAAHCPGPLSDSFRVFCDLVLSQPPRRCSCPDATVITWNSGTRPAKPCGLLERSLDRLGIPTLVLGRGTTAWNNRLKFALTAEALERVETPLVIGADSCDVVFCDDPGLAVERFRRHFTCDLLFNASGSRCWPDLPEFVEFESAMPMAAVAQQRHWLNSGLFIGRTEFLRGYFRRLAEEPPVPGYERSDQAVIKRTWPEFYPRVQLDYLSLIFQWFNESSANLTIERTLAPRQEQLLRIVRPLGERLVGAEIGVYDGGTSAALLNGLPELRLWMIDPWRPYEGKSELGVLDQAAFDRARARAEWWTLPAAERRFVLREPSLEAAQRFAAESLDFAFIDGNHLYEHVRADLHAWWPKIRAGGLLSGHDYGICRDATGQWGVRRAVDEFAGNVRRAVQVGDDGVWWIER